MKLLKFNLIFIPILALALGAIGFIAQKMLLEDAARIDTQNFRPHRDGRCSSQSQERLRSGPATGARSTRAVCGHGQR